MAAHPLRDRTWVEATRLSTKFYGQYLVGHEFRLDTQPDGHEHVLYAREGTALGKGQFGQVHLEKAQNSCAQAPPIRAVKEIKKLFSADNGIDWEREIDVLARLSRDAGNDFFLSFHGWYEDLDTVFIATEYFPLGDLSRYINDIASDEEVKTIAKQIVTGLSVMHAESIVHRDLNPRNIFVASNTPHWRVKLADFGCSKYVHESTALNTTRGTHGYMAPEYGDFIRNTSDYPPPTRAVDLWSMGCIVFELFTKKRPFIERSAEFRQYCRDHVLPKALAEGFASPQAQEAVHELLHPVAEDRITASDALCLQWFDDDTSETESELATPISHTVMPNKAPKAENESEYPSISSLTLHPTESCTSLASSVTLVNDTTGSTLSLAHARGVPPAVTSRPLPRPGVNTINKRPEPPDLPRRHTYPDNHTGPEAEQFRSPSGTGTAADKCPKPMLPPRRATGSPEARGQKHHDYEVREREQRKNTPPAKCFLSCSYKFEELHIGLGLITCQRDLSAGCDMCEDRFRMSGPNAQPMARQSRSSLHLCEKCGMNRVLCERCARDAVNRPGDPHEADHLLRRIGPAYSVLLERFLKDTYVVAEANNPMVSSYAEQWLSSDHAFQTPVDLTCRSIQTRLSLIVPPGVYQIATYIHVSFDEQKVSTEAIGTLQKKILRMSKSAFGHITVGAETLPEIRDSVVSPGGHFMPTNHLEKEIKYGSGRKDMNIIFKLKTATPVKSGEVLEVAIKSSHDHLVFKNGCPFKWSLDFVCLSQFGERVQLATKGQLLRREQFVHDQRARQKREDRDRTIGYTMKALNGGTMAFALGSSISKYQSNQAAKKGNQWDETTKMIRAAREYYGGSSVAGDSGYGGAGAGQHYDANPYDYPAASAAGSLYGDGGSGAGGASDSGFAEQWLADQAETDPQPFMGTYESVEYNIDGDGASARYTYFGAT